MLKMHNEQQQQQVGKSTATLGNPEWQQQKRDLLLFRGKGDDSDEEDDEDDNDSKADDYDGGDGDDRFFQVQHQRPYVSHASRESLPAHS